ncbi:elongation factor P [Marinobacterium arenosum]|uniref:elongation factor P n=1 Tax=Marinobacterium arenosum TaxID=2862496 RepID=UPI001C940374|nr:elongation factor P [Marinobacterium arenosum]MBY4677501.1 elongation factor P [Marinobacterium arenosum]
MKPAAEMRTGMFIRLDNELYRVALADYQAGGGKMHGVTHAKLRNVRTGNVTERRFRDNEKFEEIEIERRDMEYLYLDGDQCVFMNPETFEQVSLAQERLGAYLPFLQPNQSLQMNFFDGEALEVSYPDSVILRVESTPEPLHIQNSSVLKEATLENGLEIQVPQFIQPGDQVKIDVESHKYQERIR